IGFGGAAISFGFGFCHEFLKFGGAAIGFGSAAIGLGKANFVLFLGGLKKFINVLDGDGCTQRSKICIVY
ncbi:MAG: hypothetical protein ACKPCM_05640, partial [Pseudanabaena sp.]